MEHILETRVVPRFGRVPLQAVRRSEVQGWVAEMTDDLAPSTVESYYRVLAAVMRSAVSDELIRKTPCTGITLPKRAGNGALVPLTVEQVQALAAAMPAAYGAIVLVQAGLGLRQGEACGLTVDRVDFLRRTVTIDRQLVTPKIGDVALGPVKTEASNRTIPLPRSVGEVLSAHLAGHPAGADGFVFTSTTGAPLRRSVYGSTFRRAAEIVGVDASSHDLRHHCASLLIRSGLSVKAVQRYLGHATAAETLDTYGHLWPDDDERIRAAVDAAFDPMIDRNVVAGVGS
jgi:integrase